MAAISLRTDQMSTTLPNEVPLSSVNDDTDILIQVGVGKGGYVRIPRKELADLLFDDSRFISALSNQITSRVLLSQETTQATVSKELDELTRRISGQVSSLQATLDKTKDGLQATIAEHFSRTEAAEAELSYLRSKVASEADDLTSLGEVVHTLSGSVDEHLDQLSQIVGKHIKDLDWSLTNWIHYQSLLYNEQAILSSAHQSNTHPDNQPPTEETPLPLQEGNLYLMDEPQEVNDLPAELRKARLVTDSKLPDTQGNPVIMGVKPGLTLYNRDARRLVDVQLDRRQLIIRTRTLDDPKWAVLASFPL